jgi:hypothetical protein
MLVWIPTDVERLPIGIDRVGSKTLVGFNDKMRLGVEILAFGKVSEGSAKLDVRVGTTIEREMLTDGSKTLVVTTEGNTIVPLADGTPIVRDTLTDGSATLVGVIVEMTSVREALSVGINPVVGTIDGNPSVPLADGTMTGREILIVGSGRLVVKSDGTKIDEMFKVGMGIEIGGNGVSDGRVTTIEVFGDGATVGMSMDRVVVPGAGIESDAVGEGIADDELKNGTVMLGAGPMDSSGRVDTPPVGKRGKVGLIEIPIDTEGEGRTGRLKLGKPVPVGSSMDKDTERVTGRPVDGRGMLDGRTQLTFCASARPRRPMARLFFSRIIVEPLNEQPVSLTLSPNLHRNLHH